MELFGRTDNREIRKEWERIGAKWDREMNITKV